MKKEIYVHIPEPCHENWEQMTPVQQGRFCDSCSKKVVDFSLMSDKQILDLLSKAGSNTCGRFSSAQLERPISHENSPIIHPYKLFLSAFIPAFLLTSSNSVIAQKGKVALKTEIPENIMVGMILPEIRRQPKISGNVKDENGQPLAGASILLKGTQKGIIADKFGKFSLTAASGNGQILQVSFVGYKTKEIKVGKDRMPIQVVLSNQQNLLKGEAFVVYDGGEPGEEYEDQLPAESKVSFHGLVVNELGQPVPFASLQMNSNNGVIADSIGKFSFTSRKNKKTITIKTSSAGYRSVDSTIELNGRATDTIVIVLKNNVALNEVVVKCSSLQSLTGIAGGLSIVRTVTVRDTANTFIQKVFNNEMFKAYPNPASIGSNVTLTFKNPGNYSLQIFDNAGKLYIQKEYLDKNSMQSIALQLPTNMTSGIYYLKATNTSSNKHFIDKLIIQ